MGKKRRIYNVAKEFDISNDTLIQYLSKLGFEIRNHMTLMSDEMYDEACKKYGHQVVKEDNDYDFRRRLKEKKAQEEAQRLETQKKLEERFRVATEASKIRPKAGSEAEISEPESRAKATTPKTSTPEEVSSEITAVAEPRSEQKRASVSKTEEAAEEKAVEETSAKATKSAQSSAKVVSQDESEIGVGSVESGKSISIDLAKMVAKDLESERSQRKSQTAAEKTVTGR